MKMKISDSRRRQSFTISFIFIELHIIMMTMIMIYLPKDIALLMDTLQQKYVERKIRKCRQ